MDTEPGFYAVFVDEAVKSSVFRLDGAIIGGESSFGEKTEGIYGQKAERGSFYEVSAG